METIQSVPDIKIIFLCSPGNPTGTLLSKSDIQMLLELKDFKGVIIVDEAYIDFCPREASVVSWIAKYPNLIVTQTLSKAFGLAGIRFAYIHLLILDWVSLLHHQKSHKSSTIPRRPITSRHPRLSLLNQHFLQSLSSKCKKMWT